MHQKNVHDILQEQVTGAHTPSVQYLLFDKDRLLTQYRCGPADIRANKPADDHTVYTAYSVTKTFTALAVVQLAEQKKLDIEQPASLYLPRFPYPGNITIKQLLTHSAGIPNPVPLSWIHLQSEHASFHQNTFFHRIFTRNAKVRSKPNERYAYSNLGYVLLGQLIEQVSGTSFEDYVTGNILKPLGLGEPELGFHGNGAGHQATGYQKRLTLANFVLGFFINKKKYMEKAEDKWKPFKPFFVNGTAYGGLQGSPRAFAIYLQELLKPDCRLVSAAYKQLLFTENYTNNHKATGMCLSWFKGQLAGHDYFAHAGGGGGYYCEIRMYPHEGIGSVVFFNRTGMKDERFLDKVDRFYFEARQ